MSRWRILTVLGLLVVPVLIAAAYGCYALYAAYWWGAWVWVPMTVSMALGWVLAYYWQRNKTLLRPVDFEPNARWTDRDQQAWKLVKARAAAAKDLDADKLVDPQFYMTVGPGNGPGTGRLLPPQSQRPRRQPDRAGNPGRGRAGVARPGRDGGQVPAGRPSAHHQRLEAAGKAVDWYQSASTVYWVVSALISPINTGLRYAATQMGLTTPLQMLQENLLIWFYTAFLQRLGTYLIELNSGRLSVGATRYRQLVEGSAGGAGGRRPARPDQVRQVTVTLMGQVKAGKSSMVNALLGEQRARTDVLPATDEITRYEFKPPDVPTKLVLLDTVGYGHQGPRADQVRARARRPRTPTCCCWWSTPATRRGRPTWTCSRRCIRGSSRTPT